MTDKIRIKYWQFIALILAISQAALYNYVIRDAEIDNIIEFQYNEIYQTNSKLYVASKIWEREWNALKDYNTELYVTNQLLVNDILFYQHKAKPHKMQHNDLQYRVPEVMPLAPLEWNE
jgi:hypothetical protein